MKKHSKKKRYQTVHLGKLFQDQKDAVEKITGQGSCFFLTGSAGTGKSFVIEYLRSTIPNVAVVATTGVAAQLVRGTTLHKFAGIHPDFGVIDSRKADARMLACQLLIVDEASMATPRLVKQLFERFHRAGHMPKLLLVGDFLQLPPVCKEGGHPDENMCLFESEIWKAFTVLRLTAQHRQKDDSFISVLNDIRIGNLSPKVSDFIKSRSFPELPTDCTHLMSLRDMAERENNKRLRLLPGTQYNSVWRLTGDVEAADPRKTRFVSRLEIKVGARVIMLTNEPDGLWVNGSSGTVTSVSSGMVTIKLDVGRTVSVRRESDEIVDPDGEARCTIEQYPFQLGWALTIHKAQGMSMDKVGVDLSHHFEDGQTYVALSRCRTAEGLFLKGSIGNLFVNDLALQFS